VAVVLRIDSPGGAVAPSQEIYDEVQRVREGGKPVFASLGNVAASGGYYVASAANKILADPGTITGSIGAIMSVPYYAPLADQLGGLESATREAWSEAKQPGEPRVWRVRLRRLPWLLQLVGETLLPAARETAGGLFFLYRGPSPQ